MSDHDRKMLIRFAKHAIETSVKGFKDNVVSALNDERNEFIIDMALQQYQKYAIENLEQIDE